MHVLIAGAGIAGLAAALRLTGDGHRVTIVERSDRRRPGGYLVNLLGSGFDAAEALGLVPALREHDQGAFTSNLVRADGSTRLTMPAALAEVSLGDRALTLFRGDVESVLYGAVRDAAEIRFGTTVTAVDDDGAGPARVVLSDGTSTETDLVIGADGVRSGLRRLVFGDDAEFVVDLQHVVGAIPLADSPVGLRQQTAETFIDVGRTAAVFRPRGHRASAFFTYRADSVSRELQTGPGSAVAEHFSDVGGALGDALRGAAHADDVYFDAVSQVVMPSWRRGRVALLGDSAWCVSLFAGHGAGLALAGADSLGSALAEHADLPAALASWESRLRGDVAERQKQARVGMARFAPPSRFHLLAQDTMIRALSAPVLGPFLLGRMRQRATSR